MSTPGTRAEAERGWNGVTAGALANVAAVVCGILAAAFDHDDLGLWLGLAIAFAAAGNLLGGVRTGTQKPLGPRQD